MFYIGAKQDQKGRGPNGAERGQTGLSEAKQGQVGLKQNQMTPSFSSNFQTNFGNEIKPQWCIIYGIVTGCWSYLGYEHGDGKQA